MIKNLSLKDHRLLMALIIITAVFFRLYNITEIPPGLYHDEAIDGNYAIEALRGTPPDGGFKVFYPENMGLEGLFINIQALSIYFFGNEPWALRLVSAVFGILTVLGLYCLTQELLTYGNNKLSANKKSSIALLSAFLLATSFWHINFSRIGLRAIMSPFFITWALYFLLKSLNAQRNEEETKSTPNPAGGPRFRKYISYAILGGMFFGLGFHSYHAYRATPLLVLVLLLLDWSQNPSTRRRLLISAACFLLVTMIVVAPLGIFFLKNPEFLFMRSKQLWILNSPSPLRSMVINTIEIIGMFFFQGDANWRQNYAQRAHLFWPVGIIFLCGIFMSWRSLISPKVSSKSDENITPSVFFILFAWLVIGALPALLIMDGFFNSYRTIIMMPPIFILAGIGGISLYTFAKSQIGAHKKRIIFAFNAVCLIILLILPVEAYITYFILWGKNPKTSAAFFAGSVQLGRELLRLPEKVPKYVIVDSKAWHARGVPMTAQTVMFITDTFTPEKQKTKNIFYILPYQKNQIPKNSYYAFLR